jgi:ribosome-binding protein aMBF1 (putative translation factor)
MPRVSHISKSPPAAVENALGRLGRNIRTARLRRKLSRAVLAERIGISRYVMADIENSGSSNEIPVTHSSKNSIT